MPRQAELRAWIRLVHTPGIGRALARRLMATFGEPADVLSQAPQRLAPYLDEAQRQALLLQDATRDLFERTWAWLGDTQAAHPRAIVTLADPQYPPDLLNIPDPPLLLYALGQAWPLPSAGRCLSVVGSRKPSAQGERHAHQFAQVFAEAGWTVVSGLAGGIDAAAHRGALAGGGEQATVAVVGTGLDRVYPARNADLARQIAAQGLLVSEYPLGTPPLAHNFPQRNRIIAGLARGTLVVEAALPSGSLITAGLAADQGKDVFAIPGSILSDFSRGCHALIKQGAQLVESPQEVLDCYGAVDGLARTSGTATAAPEGSSKATPVVKASGLASALPEAASGHHRVILDALGTDPISLDELMARLGMDTSNLQAALLELELDGHIARLAGGVFQRIGQA